MPVPCKNCITLAICNGQVSDENPYKSIYDVIHNLIPKCSLIKEYTEGNYRDSSKLIGKVAKFFNPKASFIDYEKELILCLTSLVKIV